MSKISQTILTKVKTAEENVISSLKGINEQVSFKSSDEI